MLTSVHEYQSRLSTAVLFVDLDECSTSNGGCSDVCVNTIGWFYCNCSRDGYILSNNNHTCIDVDECAINISLCKGDGLTCFNTIGGFACVAAAGI